MQVSFNALNADYLLQDFHVYRRSDQYSGLTSSFWKVALIVWSKMEISTSELPTSGFSTQLAKDKAIDEYFKLTWQIKWDLWRTVMPIRAGTAINCGLPKSEILDSTMFILR